MTDTIARRTLAYLKRLDEERNARGAVVDARPKGQEAQALQPDADVRTGRSRSRSVSRSRSRSRSFFFLPPSPSPSHRWVMASLTPAGPRSEKARSVSPGAGP